MSEAEPKHFIVKHGLDAFELLPNYIWRTDMSAKKAPRGFGQVNLRDRWIGFAYEFDHIRDYTLSHQFDTTTIPLLGREPECEQEVVAVLANCYEKVGITKVHRVRTAFPDLLVQIDGGPEKVHLELELYSESFLSHGHHNQMADGQFHGDPVAVLCWIDNKEEVKKHVHEVYELQSLLREGKRMTW